MNTLPQSLNGPTASCPVWTGVEGLKTEARSYTAWFLFLPLPLADSDLGQVTELSCLTFCVCEMGIITALTPQSGGVDEVNECPAPSTVMIRCDSWCTCLPSLSTLPGQDPDPFSSMPPMLCARPHTDVHSREKHPRRRRETQPP